MEMNQTILQSELIHIQNEANGMLVTLANRDLIINKLRHLKQKVMDEYRSNEKIPFSDSFDFLNNIWHMDNSARDQVITFCENLMLIDLAITKVDTAFSRQE